MLVKYFNPCGAGTWLITEGEQQENGDWLLFGYMYIFEWEWGYVMLSELENIELPFGLKLRLKEKCMSLVVKLRTLSDVIIRRKNRRCYER